MKFARRMVVSLALCLAPCAFAQQEQHSGTAADVASTLQQASARVAANRLAEAEVLYSQALTLTPSDNAVRTMLAKVKSRLGKTEEAIELFRKVAAVERTSSDAHLNLAIALADTRRANEALEELHTSIRLDPKSARAHLNRARLLADLHKTSEARAEFVRADSLSPKNPEIDYFWGVFEKELHNAKRAASLLSSAVDHDPSNFQALYLLGQEQQALGRKEAAIASWKKAITLNPQFAEAVYALSQALRESDPEQASQLLQQFQKLHAETGVLERVRELGNQAYAAMQEEKWDFAVSTLHQALDLCAACPLEADLHQRLGLAECHRGNLDAGTRELHVALELDPKNSDTLQALQWVKDHTK